jgi:O-acetylserine/cysteine efflux transporter
MTGVLPLKDLALVLVVVIAWGFNFVAAKVGLTTVPPLVLLGVRFTIVGLCLVPFVRWPRRQMAMMWGVSVILGVLHFGVMFTGLQYVDAATAALVGQLQVPFAVILGVVVYREALGVRAVLGIALAFVGLFIVLGKEGMHYDWVGVGLIAAASFMWSFSNLMVKKITDTSGIGVMAWMSLLAGPQLLVASLLLEDQPFTRLMNGGWQGVSSLIYMIIFATFVAYGGWYTLLQRRPVSVLAPFMLLVPIFGVLSGILFLDEHLTWQILVGGALTIAGIGVINIRPAARPASEKA